MERGTIPPSVDVETQQILNYIMDGATPLPIILTSAPTTAGAELKEGQVGQFGTNLYQTINGTTYRMPLTAV